MPWYILPLEIICSPQNIWTWWYLQVQIEKFSALLTLCVGNSPVTGEFPSQRPVMLNFDVFLDLNKRFNKQLWRRWFETPLRPLWCHCNEKMKMLENTSTKIISNSEVNFVPVDGLAQISVVPFAYPIESICFYCFCFPIFTTWHHHCIFSWICLHHLWIFFCNWMYVKCCKLWELKLIG